MSKRARITLNSATEETVTEPSPEIEPQADDDFVATAETPAAAALPVWKTLPVGTIVKAAVAGLAVVSTILIWTNRRP